MSKDNQVSVKISGEEQAQLNEAVKTIQRILKPHFFTISTAERQEIPKMSEKTVPFVKKALEYAETHPEFAPAYMNVSELRIDIEAFDLLMKLYKPLNEISTELVDTIMLSGSEAYVAALAYYNSVKQAVKMNIPGAKVIYEDLRTRFEGNGPKTSKAAKS